MTAWFDPLLIELDTPLPLYPRPQFCFAGCSMVRRVSKSFVPLFNILIFVLLSFTLCSRLPLFSFLVDKRYVNLLIFNSSSHVFSCPAVCACAIHYQTLNVNISSFDATGFSISTILIWASSVALFLSRFRFSLLSLTQLL